MFNILADLDPTIYPAMRGRHIEGSLNDFELRCRLHLGEELKKIAPDNTLVALLCDGVRLAREYGDKMKERLSDGTNALMEKIPKKDGG